VSERRRLGPMLGIVGLFAMLSAMSCAYAVVRFGSLRSALAFARGERLVVEGGVRDLGDLPLGSEHEVRVTIRNLGRSSIRILGAKSSCSCMAAADKPRGVPPGESRAILIHLHVDRESEIAGEVTLYTDEPNRPELPIGLKARGVPPTRGPFPAAPRPEQPSASKPRL